MKEFVRSPANSLHMLWQVPQYIIMTAGEVMFSVTGLEFSYSQAPVSMKSVLQACWLLTVAIGNVIVVAITHLKFFQSQAAEFFLFAVLMVIDMGIFVLIAMRYKYVVHDDVHGDEDKNVESNIQLERKDGTLPKEAFGKEVFPKETFEREIFPKDGHTNRAYNAE